MSEKKSGSKSLSKAKTNKSDEFYTQLSDIEKELWHYKDYFKGKVVFCNCDDPEESHFWRYFEMNFEHLWLKKLVATHYQSEKPSYKLEIVSDINHDGRINGRDVIKTPLKQNWDFRSPECIEILEESDIVVTNPPFSLFREYVAQLFQYNKKFIIIWNQNSITYKEFFKLIKDDRVWLGYGFNGGAAHFINKHYEDYATAGSHKEWMIRVSWVVWFTNIEIEKRHEDMILYKVYTPEEYPTYDNYDAIEVSKTKDIPVDYPGLMWVPITFLNKYSPEQFEIIGLLADKRELSDALVQWIPTYLDEQHKKYVWAILNGKATYARIIIRNKKLNS